MGRLVQSSPTARTDRQHPPGGVGGNVSSIDESVADGGLTHTRSSPEEPGRFRPPVAYGLLVWIKGACDWDLNRRAGHIHELLPPEAAIDPSEDGVSINATRAMVAQFSRDSPAGRAFFDALMDLLTGSGPKH